MRLIVAVFALVHSALALAVSPYIAGDKVNGGDLASAMAQVEGKLLGAGFTIVGRHLPPGLPQYGTVVVTDQGVLDAVTGIGGSAIAGAVIRVGVKADGSVSYMNPDYWYRAYLRRNFSKAEPAVRAVQDKLGKTLGAGNAFGGDLETDDLPTYRYMFGMERFESAKNELNGYPGFQDAVKTIRDNLAKGTRHTAKVYEVVLPAKKLAVFGVAMNDPEYGEAWWVNKIGPDHVAALPWEIYVVNDKAYALYGRYRTALGWPELGMGTFMSIMSHPDTAREMLTAVAGGKIEQPGGN